MCSIQGCDCATASSSNSAARSFPPHPQSAFSSAPLITSAGSLAKSKSRTEKSSPYSYDLLRSDPTAVSLKHIASNEHGPLFRGHTRHVPPNIKVPHPSPAPQNHPSSIPQPSTRSRQPHSDPHSNQRQPYFDDYPHQSNSLHGLHPKGLAYRVTSRSRDTSVEYPYPPPSGEPYSLHDVDQHCEDDLDSNEYHERRAAAMDDRRAVSNTISTLDTMGRKHVCPTCFKRFNRPSSLRIHVNTHTGATRKYIACFPRIQFTLLSIFKFPGVIKFTDVILFSTAFKCPWPNCGRKFNVNSNMRRHYRNHITSSRNQGTSLLAPSLSTAEMLRINQDEVPALVPATLPLSGPPSITTPHILVSKPDGPDPSTDRLNPLMSHRGVPYHDGHNQYLGTGEQKRVVLHGSHQIHRHQGLGGNQSADSYAREIVTPEVGYPDMHSPPTSHSSLSDADDGFGVDMFADDNKSPRLSPGFPLTRVRLGSLDSAYRPRRVASPPFNEDEPKRETHSTHFPTTNTRLALSSDSSDRWITASARSSIPSPSISEVSSLAMSRPSSPEEVARRHSEPSTVQPRYSASRPYFESLMDSHVSTTLRPAFMRSSSSLHCTR